MSRHLNLALYLTTCLHPTLLGPCWLFSLHHFIFYFKIYFIDDSHFNIYGIYFDECESFILFIGKHRYLQLKTKFLHIHCQELKKKKLSNIKKKPFNLKKEVSSDIIMNGRVRTLENPLPYKNKKNTKFFSSQLLQNTELTNSL